MLEHKCVPTCPMRVPTPTMATTYAAPSLFLPIVSATPYLLKGMFHCPY